MSEPTTSAQRSALAQRDEQRDERKREQDRSRNVDSRFSLDRRLGHEAVHENERHRCDERARG